MKKFSDQARDTETSTGKLDDAFNALSPSTLAAVAGVTALVGALKGLTDGFKTAIANYSHFEKLQMGLTTFFQDADKGADKFEELRKLSMETTFGVDELTQSFTEMANVGVDVDTINDKMIMLGNVAQGDKEKFASLVSIYSKISSTGKASAMQMQQLALRGIPIYKVLKEIGVQGTATADDITKAFEKMTEEGGQFHNAMQNINETIEGKEGFISDYFKEFTVNFAEVTGLADAYKKALDVIKEAIGAISDKLLEWNDNPMAKALLSGALVGVITLIGSVIATAIIPRLALVIKSLITMNLLQGPKGWAVLAVAGVGMAVTAYASYCKSAEEATEETKKLADAADKMKDSLKIDEYKRAAGVMPTSASRQSRYESQKNFVAGLEQGLSDSMKELVEAEKELAEMQSNADTLGYAVELVEGYEELTKRVKELREEEAKRDAGKMEYINGERAKLTALEKEIENYNKLYELQDKYNELGVGMLGVSKEEQELSNLKKQLQTVLDYKNKLIELDGKYDNNGYLIRYDDDTRNEIDKTVDYFQREIDKIELNIKIANQKDWQKALQDAFGFDNETQGKLLDAWKNGKATGDDWVKKYVKDMEERYRRIDEANKKYGVNTNDNMILKQAEDVFKAYNTLLEGAGDFDFDDNAIVSLMNRIDQLRDEYVKAGGKLEDFEDALNNVTETVEEVEEILKKTISEKLVENLQEGLLEGLTTSKYGNLGVAQAQYSAYSNIQGTDVGKFMNYMDEENSDWRSSLIQVAIDDLVDVIGGLEKLGYVLNIVHNVIDAFSPVLEALFNIIGFIGWILKPILDGLKKVFSWLFGDFNDACDELYHSMEDEADQRKKNTQELANQYQRLIAVMKEQEEYYIHKKAELNAFALENQVNGITPVNDMILTPHGTFSTNPNDTIIATKNPSGLGGGDIKVTVNNYSDSSVDVQQRKDANGITEMLVTISKKIASDVAGGYNGWDGALAMQKQRVDGRRV